VDINAQLAVMRPVVQRIANKLHCTLPANVEKDDLSAEGMAAAWLAIESYKPDIGTLEGHVASRARFAMLDFLRRSIPGGKDRLEVQFVDEADLNVLASDSNPAMDVERAQEYDARLRQVPTKHREVIRRVLEGESMKSIAEATGVSEARVSQKLAATVSHLQAVRPRTSKGFDPDAVIIRSGSMPPPKTSESKTQKLIKRMGPTDSVILNQAAAETLRRELKRLRIPLMTYRHSPTQIEVWREPSDEQRAARTTSTKRI